MCNWHICTSTEVDDLALRYCRAHVVKYPSSYPRHWQPQQIDTVLCFSCRADSCQTSRLEPFFPSMWFPSLTKSEWRIMGWRQWTNVLLTEGPRHMETCEGWVAPDVWSGSAGLILSRQRPCQAVADCENFNNFIAREVLIHHAQSLFILSCDGSPCPGLGFSEKWRLRKGVYVCVFYSFPACFCVCLCVWVGERERESVCVCVDGYWSCLLIFNMIFQFRSEASKNENEISVY